MNETRRSILKKMSIATTALIGSSSLGTGQVASQQEPSQESEQKLPDLEITNLSSEEREIELTVGLATNTQSKPPSIETTNFNEKYRFTPALNASNGKARKPRTASVNFESEGTYVFKVKADQGEIKTHTEKIPKSGIPDYKSIGIRVLPNNKLDIYVVEL